MRRRRRLRRLRWAIFGAPRLVLPAPVLGRRPEPRVATANDNLADSLIFGVDSLERRPRRGLRLKGPSDAEWRERYNALRNGHVTYEPRAAQERLLSMLENDRGGAITTVVVEPNIAERQLWQQVAFDRTIKRN